MIPKNHPYAIVLSQDCDLIQDRVERDKADSGEDVPPEKLIPNVLFCEVVSAQSLRGTTSNPRLWDSIVKNDNKRYQFLQKVEPHEDAFKEGLPELGIDFKRYFSIPTGEVYRRLELGEAKRHCVLVSPYLEHFSTRFAFFLSRVGLDPDHTSE